MRMLEAIEELKQVRRELQPHELVIKRTASEILEQQVRRQLKSNLCVRGWVCEVNEAAVLAETQDRMEWDRVECETHAWLDAVEEIYKKQSNSKTRR